MATPFSFGHHEDKRTSAPVTAVHVRCRGTKGDCEESSDGDDEDIGMVVGMDVEHGRLHPAEP